MSFPSRDYSGENTGNLYDEYSYNAQDDGYSQSELTQDPLLHAMGLRRELPPSESDVSGFIASLGRGQLNNSNMFSPDLVPTRGANALFNVRSHENITGAATMPERQQATGTQVYLFILFRHNGPSDSDLYKIFSVIWWEPLSH
jgi:hypothetical protein